MTWQIIQADARQIPLKDKSVQCCVTSPPYWGLRDYGTARWEGGEDGCDHVRISGGPRGATLEGGDQRGRSEYPYPFDCGKCGATRIDSQIGLEKTPEEYVAKIVAVFREVKRVLRDDSTVWVNLGDSYGHGTDSGRQSSRNGAVGGWQSEANEIRRNGIKAKDLVGIPWRCAFALQADGWYLRSDIIWSKPNPMPESVTDRPTKAHEYIFLLTKKERYYFDQDAVREEHTSPMTARNRWQNGGGSKESMSGDPTQNYGAMEYNPAGRNIRTVWEIATQPFPSAHFATFPEAIAERCIKAGTSEKGACAECGAPRGRVIPTCKHDAPSVPCVVLDPFGGAGTVPLVADKLNRKGIGLELKFDYCRMAERRCYDDAPLFSCLTLAVD